MIHKYTPQYYPLIASQALDPRMDQDKYRQLVSQIRSEKEADKLEALSQIPHLISLSLQQHANSDHHKSSGPKFNGRDSRGSNSTLTGVSNNNNNSHLDEAGENNNNNNQHDEHDEQPTVNHLLDQLLLLIYNLNTPDDEEKFKSLKANNRILILRHLLRLYLREVESHSHKQLEFLRQIINLSQYSPELLIELANVLHVCSKKLADPKKTQPLIDEALDNILSSARTGLYPDALLMIYSIYAIREREQNQKQEYPIPTT